MEGEEDENIRFPIPRPLKEDPVRTADVNELPLGI